MAEDAGPESVLGWLEHLGVVPKAKLYKIIVDALGGDRGMLANEDPQYLKESYGEQFVSSYIPKQPEEIQTRYLNEFNALSEEEGDTGRASIRFIEENNLESDLFEWLLSDYGWSGENWLSDVYSPEDLAEAYKDLINANIPKILEESYEPYLEHFETGGEMDKPLREAIKDIENTLEVLEEAQTGTLD
jgi:hypothetical protein